MLQYSGLLEFQIMIFLLMAAGFILRRLSILAPGARKALTDVIITFILPCNILSSFFIEMNLDILRSFLAVLLISVGIQIFCDFFGRAAYRRVPHGQQAVLKYGTLCPNAAFLGNPLAEGLYGAQGVVYSSIYLIPQRVVMWSAGVAYFSETRDKDVVKKVLTHPCILATVLGLVIMCFQIPLPGFLTRSVRTVSQATTAATMLVIGGILAEIDMKTVFNRLTLVYSLIRLLLLPLLVLAVCRLLGLGHLVSAVSVVLTGMPAGATTAILAERYNADANFAVKCVFLSTVLSLVTIPGLCMLAERVFS